MNNVGVVVIGRNEGERLKVCIRSLAVSKLRIVYVDSGSTDGSVQFVRDQGFEVIALDMTIPFSAARARNEGYRFLLDKYAEINLIQFIDGDCEICEGWIQEAYKHLSEHAGLAAVCGRRRERYPRATLYNKLCDMEWDTPVGLAMATGGDFMCRKKALIEVNGFLPQVIAGEEPELCFRMREKGWEIERIDAEMTLHDANMTVFSQWWKRCERSGHAYAQGFYMHGQSKEHYYCIDLLRILIWALLIPIFFIVFCFFWGELAGFLLLLYPLKIGQIFISQLNFFGVKVSLAYASSLVLGKFPQCKGVISFFYKCLMGKNFQIIEYKNR
jgi:GT2 family glycosyltransferase